jgi:gliding motility-associated-like protein
MIVQDNFGCADTVDSTITVNITPVSAFTIIDKLDGYTGKIQLTNLSTGATLYDWDFGNGKTSTEENPSTSYGMDGTYVIKLISTNQFNCTDTTYYKYEVLFKGLYVPNAFSPTSTNLSVRLFKPVGLNLKQYDIQVYDSWGHLLWESNKLDTEGRPLEGWDGTFNGVLMPQATYMWKASATFIDDTIWQGSDIGMGDAKTIGTVSLIR